MCGTMSMDKNRSFNYGASNARKKCCNSKEKEMSPIFFPNDIKQSCNQYISCGNVCIVFEKYVKNLIVVILIKMEVKLVFAIIRNSQKPREVYHKKNQKEWPLPLQ